MEYKVLNYVGSHSSEAVLQITSNAISLVAYCNPYKPPQKDGLILLAFLTENIVLEEKMVLPVKNNNGFFSYHITAKITDRNMRFVSLGDIIIELDTDIPKDIPNGSVISFDTIRLDVI